MSITKHIFFLALSLTLSSCIIRGEFKGLYSYRSKSQKTAPDLFRVWDEKTVLNNLNEVTSQKVEILDGKTLLANISKKPLVYLYYWKPLCTADVCVSPEIFKDHVSNVTNNATAINIAEYYDVELMQKYVNSSIIVAINTDIYSSSRTNIYTKKFYDDLGIDDLNDYLFFKFEFGKLTASYSKLQEIN